MLLFFGVLSISCWIWLDLSGIRGFCRILSYFVGFMLDLCLIFCISVGFCFLIVGFMLDFDGAFLDL